MTTSQQYQATAREMSTSEIFNRIARYQAMKAIHESNISVVEFKGEEFMQALDAELDIRCPKP